MKNQILNAIKSIAVLAVLILPSAAHAQVAQSLLIDSKAHSLGNAVTADPPGVKSIHYNPAGLTRLKGRHFEFALMNAYLDIDANFIAPEGYNIFGIDGVENDPVANQNSHTNQIAAYVPGIGMVYLPPGPGAAPTMGFAFNNPGSKFTFANAFYMPLFGGWAREDDDPGRYMPLAAALQRITYASPSFGYEINDEWSVGAGVHFSYSSVAAKQWMRAPNMMLGVAEILQEAFNCESGNEPLAPFVTLCGGNVGPFDDIGAMHLELDEKLSPSYTVGVLWSPNDWFTWGANYESGSDMRLKGQFELRYTEDFSGFWQRFNSSIIGAISAAILSLPSGVPREAGNVSMDLTYPQHFQTGVSVTVHPKLTVNADLGWTDYKKWDAFNLKFDRALEFLGAARILSPENATATTLRLPLGMVDEWNVGVGVEFHVNERLDLRAGVEFRDSVTPDDQRQLMAPFGDNRYYGVGLGYQWSKATVLDFSLSYLQSIEYIPANGSSNMNLDSLTNIVYNPYAGLDVKWSTRFAQAGFTFRHQF